MEDFAGVTSRAVRNAIIQGGHQNWIPEVPDRKLSLSRSLQPLFDAFIVFRRKPAKKLHEAAGHAQLVFPSKHRHAQETRSKMKRRWKTTGRDFARSAAGLEESLLIVPTNLVRTSTLFTQVDEIGAATKQHMLRIHILVQSGMFVRAGPAANVWLAFENCDALPCPRKTRG